MTPHFFERGKVGQQAADLLARHRSVDARTRKYKGTYGISKVCDDGEEKPVEHGYVGAVWGKTIADRHEDHEACLQESMRADREGDEVDIDTNSSSSTGPASSTVS